MRLVSNSNGEWYQVIEELVCPFNEKKDYIILKNDEILYWQNANDYYHDMKLDIEQMKSNIRQIEITKWRSEERKQKTLTFLRDTLSKMIAYKREFKINEVLDKTNKELEKAIKEKDKEGNIFSTSVYDDRYLSGELVGVTKGVPISEEHKKKISEAHKHIKKPWLLGNSNALTKHPKKECPKCGKIGGGPNMTRYHFENCKHG